MSINLNTQPIIQNEIFHIYNRSNGGELIFSHHTDCIKFLGNCKKFLLPVSEIYAYVLIPNHFHFMLKVTVTTEKFSKAVGDLCNSYARWYNLKYRRNGNLFNRPFKRSLVGDESYSVWLAWYIHRNPLHHHITPDWEHYPLSSFPAYMSNSPTSLNKDFLLTLFGGKEAMRKHHLLQMNGVMDPDIE